MFSLMEQKKVVWRVAYWDAWKVAWKVDLLVVGKVAWKGVK